ncbi:MAG: antitoxin [Betaproteobacteria bacterium]|nr:MAG: antitoxin [Betaproteobacteria bacterium]
MRTTVTIDPDVQVLLRKAMRERGEPFKKVLNAALRAGLGAGARAPGRRFRQRTFDLGKPLVDLTKALALAAELDDARVAARPRRRASGR